MEKNTAINERQIQKKETFGKRSFLTFPKSGRSHAEYEILSQMLSGISASNYYKEELGFLKDDTCNKLAIYIIDYYRTHTLMEIADLLDTIKEETVKTLALDIADWELAREEVDMEVLKEAVEKVKDCFLEVVQRGEFHVGRPVERRTDGGVVRRGDGARRAAVEGFGEGQHFGAARLERT